jgi:hypothetical protein
MLEFRYIPDEFLGFLMPSFYYKASHTVQSEIINLYVIKYSSKKMFQMKVVDIKEVFFVSYTFLLNQVFFKNHRIQF